MEKENKIKKYVCPNCNEEQTTAIAVKNIDKSYVYDLENETLTEDNEYAGDNQFEYICPDCHQPLPFEICKHFYY